MADAMRECTLSGQTLGALERLSRRRTARVARIALMAACSFALAACRPVAPPARAQEPRPPKATEDEFRAPKPTDRPTVLKEATLAGLTPMITGPGIVVCEPVAANTTGSVPAFATGCGRWLHFAVGGRGEFPQTPLWQDLPRAQREMGRKDLRLDASDAAALRRITGTTHAAFGTISGTSARCRLTYRLWDIVKKKPVGNPVVAEGALASISAKLPEMANTLATALGAKSPGPRAPAPTAADLAALGRVRWDPIESLTLAQDRDLKRLASRLAPAGLILFDRYRRRTNRLVSQVVERLMRQAPENALVVAEIGCFDPWDFGDDGAKAAARLQNRFPDHAAMMAATGSWCAKTLDAPVDAVEAAKEAVRAAPSNPALWMALCDTISRVADSVRKGRYWSDLTPEEADFARRLYPVALDAARKAVALDPLYAYGWHGVAFAASLDGDEELANRALWTSVRLDETNYSYLFWGITIYRPVWFNNQAQMDRVVHKMVAVAKASPEPQWCYAYAFQVRQVGYPHEYKVMAQLAIGGFRKMLAADPSDVYAQVSLSNAIYWMGDLAGGIRVAEAGTKRSPKSAEAWENLGYLYREQGTWDKAAEGFGQAVKLDPLDSVSRRDLAFVLLWLKRAADAEAVAREGIRLQPEYWRNYSTLGGVFTETKRPDDAIQAFLRAIELNDKYYHTLDGESESGLATAYVQKGMANEAIEHARKAIGNHPVPGVPHIILGDAYVAANKDADALREYNTGIKMQEFSPNTHLKRGKLLLKLGRKTEARADWKETVQSAPDTDMAKEAQQLLAENP